MGKHFEMRFSGAGGQGLMLMGDVFAHAAGFEDHEILLTKSYGPESRGGACRSELIVDSGEITYPAITAPDFVLCMSQKSCMSYTGDIADNGILLTDSSFVEEMPKLKKSVQIYTLPLTDLAVEATGKAVAANVVAIGAVSVLCPIVSRASVEEALSVCFPAKFHASNKLAFEIGIKVAEELLNEKD